MNRTRHVNVFYRSNGNCIHDKSWDDQPAPTHTPDPPKTKPIPPATLWPLIQVFIQFAREVQGGSVKRLVFRNPHEYAPSLKSFQSAPHQTNTHQKPPVVVHIAHDQLFAVAVTEMLSPDAPPIDFANEDGENAPVLTISQFCHSCLDFLNNEQTAFLATFAKDDFAQTRQVGAHSRQRSREHDTTPRGNASTFRAAAGSTSSSGSRTSSSQSDLTASFEDRVELAPAVTRDPVVTIDDSRLSEYISKTQTLLRM